VSPWDLEESGGAAVWIRGPKAISVLATVLLGASLQHYLDPVQLSATDPEILCRKFYIWQSTMSDVGRQLCAGSCPSREGRIVSHC
jgi:hypothetical protein